MENICKFVPVSSNNDVIHTINFVYEKENPGNILPVTNSVYRVNLVVSGSAAVTQSNIRKNVKKGDIYFIFPSVPYTVECDDDFSIMYISYIGIRANAIMDRLGITSKNFYFEADEEVYKLWKRNIDVSNVVIDIACESVLLNTIAYVGDIISTSGDDNFNASVDKFMLIKKYIDENFSNPDLSLSKLSEEFSYNKKYISSAFKKHFKIGISKYLYTVRINHACVLIDRNYKSASDIAFLCGFSDPVHFSKIFKKEMGVSPRDYIKQKNS